jgi:hypothetical protein
MVHEGEGLALGPEAGDDLARVHAGLDDLQRDETFDRLGLLGHPDGPHAALADLLDQLVRADQRAGAFGDRVVHRLRQGRPGRLVERPHLGAGAQEPLDAGAEIRVAGAGRVQEGGPRLGRVLLGRLEEDRPDPIGLVAHGTRPLRHSGCVYFYCNG